MECDGRSQRPVGGQAGLIAGAGAAAAFAAWAVRGRSSSVFAPSVWRGSADRKAVALTFDDGPGQGTPEVLRVLDAHGAKATFFVCGAHVRRRPAVARDIVTRGHEVGNHTDTHARLWLRSAVFIRDELARAQESIREATGVRPVLFRATYGVRWPGLRAAQRELGLVNIMWSTIGRDWVLDAGAIVRRLQSGLCPGAIYCLHDGRERDTEAGIGNTVAALREFLPRLADAGYECVTVSDLISRTSPPSPPESR